MTCHVMLIVKCKKYRDEGDEGGRENEYIRCFFPRAESCILHVCEFYVDIHIEYILIQGESTL